MSCLLSTCRVPGSFKKILSHLMITQPWNVGSIYHVVLWKWQLRHGEFKGLARCHAVTKWLRQDQSPAA